jgi:hypothetical protein
VAEKWIPIAQSESIVQTRSNVQLHRQKHIETQILTGSFGEHPHMPFGALQSAALSHFLWHSQTPGPGPPHPHS